MRGTVNNESTTTEAPRKNEQQPMPLGGDFNAFYWRQSFTLYSVYVKTQNHLTHMDASLIMQCIIKEKRSYQANTL